MNTLLLILYIVGYIIAWRQACLVALEDLGLYGGLDKSDIAISCLVATIFSFVWPLWLIPMTLYYLLVKKQLDNMWWKEEH